MLHPHVVSQELAEELRKEGWPQTSEFYWRSPLPHYGYNEWSLGDCQMAHGADNISAPLASELMERIENNFDLFYGGRLWYAKEPVGDEQFTDKNVCNALAKLALYLKKEGIMKF